MIFSTLFLKFRSRSSFRQVRVAPVSRESPIPLGSCDGRFQSLGGFRDRQSGTVPDRHEPNLVRRAPFGSVSRFVQGQKFVRAVLGRDAGSFQITRFRLPVHFDSVWGERFRPGFAESFLRPFRRSPRTRSIPVSRSTVALCAEREMLPNVSVTLCPFRIIAGGFAVWPVVERPERIRIRQGGRACVGGRRVRVNSVLCQQKRHLSVVPIQDPGRRFGGSTGPGALGAAFPVLNYVRSGLPRLLIMRTAGRFDFSLQFRTSSFTFVDPSLPELRHPFKKSRAAGVISRSILGGVITRNGPVCDMTNKSPIFQKCEKTNSPFRGVDGDRCLIRSERTP